MPRSFAARLLVALVLLIGAHAAFAQSANVRLRAARTDTIPLDSGHAVTAVFALRNDGTDTAKVHPLLVVPTGWSALNDTSALRIAPRSADTWLVSVSAPANATA